MHQAVQHQADSDPSQIDDRGFSYGICKDSPVLYEVIPGGEHHGKGLPTQTLRGWSYRTGVIPLPSPPHFTDATGFTFASAIGTQVQIFRWNRQAVLLYVCRNHNPCLR
jgi:hypothetical protein